MGKHGLDGAMFIRYLDSATDSPTGSRRSRIGFMLDRDHQAESPFQIAQQRPEVVAYRVIEGRPVSMRRDYAVIQDWIEANGYTAAGPITEIYGTASPRKAIGPQRTEIQVTLDVVLPPSLAREAPSPTESDESSSTGQTVLGEQGTGTQDAGQQGGPVDNEAIKAVTSGESSVDETVDTRTAPTHDTPDVPTTAPTPAATPTGKDAEPVRTPSNPEPTPTVPSVQPIRDLMAAGRFDQIANQIMPEDRSIPAALQVWFGQVVFRLGAAAKGIKQVYPGQEDVVTVTIDAINQRYKQVSLNFELDPLDQVVVNVDVRADPVAQQRRSIMRDLDTLLVRIAFRSVDAGAAIDEFTTVVQRVQSLMQKQTNKPLQRTSPRKGL